MPFELEIGEMTALFEMTERFTAKLVKPRFIVPSKAPVIEELLEEVISVVDVEPSVETQSPDPSTPLK